MKMALSDGVSTIELGELAPGDAGIAATIACMQAVIDFSAHGPGRGIIERCVGSVNTWAPVMRTDDADDRDFAECLYDWCRERIKFRKDPDDVELIRLPSWLGLDALGNNARGDCDDLACLACSILAVWGARPVIITVGREPKALGGRFEHVFWGIELAGAGDELTPEYVVPFDPQEGVPPGEWGTVALNRVRCWRCNVTRPGGAA